MLYWTGLTCMCERSTTCPLKLHYRCYMKEFSTSAKITCAANWILELFKVTVTNVVPKEFSTSANITFIVHWRNQGQKVQALTAYDNLQNTRGNVRCCTQSICSMCSFLHLIWCTGCMNSLDHTQLACAAGNLGSPQWPKHKNASTFGYRSTAFDPDHANRFLPCIYSMCNIQEMTTVKRKQKMVRQLMSHAQLL